MRIQDLIVSETKEAMAQAFRYAKAVPADKVGWSPLDQGRTVLDLCQELARCGDWTYEMLAENKQPDWSEETQAKEKAIADTLSTVELCEAEANKHLARLAEYYPTIPDERFQETMWLPFEGGRDFTILEIMDYPRWNANYHLGQIAYIQMLYGDKDMH
jgi:hypothetical protein